MTAPTHSVQHRFSAAAPSYDDHAEAQRTSADLLLKSHLMPAEPSRILDVGCGTGYVTALLRAQFPQCPIDAIDAAPQMIQCSRSRLADATAIDWHTGGLMTFTPPHRYPLIVSNAALHWIEPLTAAFAKLYALASENAHLACAVMLDGTLAELRESRLQVAPHKPPLGRLPTKDEVLYALQSRGFVLQESRPETRVTTYASADAFLDAIHDMGLTGGRVSQGAVPLNREELARLRSHYQHHFALANGTVRATYRFLLVHARAT